MGLMRRTIHVGGLVALLATTLYAAAALPRDTLWHVEQTCVLNQRTTGSPFPCLAVEPSRGFVVLRAPLANTHIVVMPTTKTVGVEDPRLIGDESPNYFQDAWDARSFVQSEVPRPLGWGDVGLAVNSRSTRTQDQLHIHVDCVNPRVKLALAAAGDRIPADRWMDAGLVIYGHPLWARRIAAPSLDGVNVLKMADDIPGFATAPAETMLAVIGTVAADGSRGFTVLANQSDPARAGSQFTSEHLLDHRCRIR